LDKPWTPIVEKWSYEFWFEGKAQEEKGPGGLRTFTHQEDSQFEVKREGKTDKLPKIEEPIKPRSEEGTIIGRELNPQIVDYVKIYVPVRYETFLPYVIVSTLIAYAGFWFIRSIVWSVKYLVKTGKH